MCAKNCVKKKDMIIRNFISLIQECGINRITLSDVADRSGLTKSALYYYFESKEALMIDGFEHFNCELNDKMRPLIDKAETPFDKLSAYCDFKLKVVSGKYEEFQELVNMSDEVFFEIQKYMLNSPDIVQKIVSSRDTELSLLNTIIAQYLGEKPEDERTRKATLMFAGFFHSYLNMSSHIAKHSETFTSNEIMSQFPWCLDTVENRDVIYFLIGGINMLHKQLFI